MPDVYQLLEDRYNRKPIDDVLTEEERLTAALDCLWGCEEFCITPIRDAIPNADGEITYHDLGRMLHWAESMRFVLNTLVERHDEIRQALHELGVRTRPRSHA